MTTPKANFIARHKKAIIKRLVVFIMLVLCVIHSNLLKVVYYDFADLTKLTLGNTYLKDNKKSITIALITDFHACYYGDNQSWLIDELKKGVPNLILLGGDIYDDQRAFKNADELLSQLSNIAPSYYVDGNHENWLPKADYDAVMRRIESYGIKIIHAKQIHIPDSNIYLYGVSDPDGGHFEQDLNTITPMLNKNHINVLLSHRPEQIDNYRQYPFDLILSGHAHGGQWRVPFLINGVFAPNQGILPKYAGGLYEFEQGQTKFIVSRGLARESTRVPRLFNRPELVFITLSTNR